MKSGQLLYLALFILSGCAGMQTSETKPAEDKFQNVFFAARQKVESEKYAQAKPLLEEYIRKSPRGLHVDQSMLFLGQLAMRDKKYAIADSYFNRIIAKSPPSNMLNLARYYRARNWEAQGKKLEALSSLAQVNDREGVFPDPEKLRLFLFWGKLAHEFKQPRDAALAYRRAYHLSEDLNNTVSLEESRVQLQNIIQNELNITDLETFLRIATAGSAPAAMAQKRLDELKGAGAVPGEAVSTTSAPAATEMGAIPAAPPLDLAQVPETFGEENKLGLLLPIDNVERPWGKSIYEGMQMAIKKNGSHLQLVVSDPGNTVETARVAVDHLIRDEKVMAIVGPLTGDQAYVAAKRAEASGVPFISTSPRTQAQWGATTINFSFDFRKQAQALVKFATENLSATRYAMIFPRDEFGKGFAEAFQEAVARVGGKFTAIESYPTDQKDFRKNIENMVGLGTAANARWSEREQMQKDYQEKIGRPLKDKEKRDIKLPAIVDFDVVFIPDSYKAIGQIAPLFAYYDINGVTLMGPSTWNSSQVIKRAGQFLDESVIVDFFTKTSPNEVVQEFLKNYEREYGRVPGALSALGYDLASSIDKAMKESSSNRKTLLQRFVTLGEFVGVIGIEKWDAYRDPISEVQVFRIRKNAIQYQQSMRIR